MTELAAMTTITALSTEAPRTQTVDHLDLSFVAWLHRNLPFFQAHLFYFFTCRAPFAAVDTASPPAPFRHHSKCLAFFLDRSTTASVFAFFCFSRFPFFDFCRFPSPCLLLCSLLVAVLVFGRLSPLSRQLLQLPILSITTTITCREHGGFRQIEVKGLQGSLGQVQVHSSPHRDKPPTPAKTASAKTYAATKG